MNRYTPHLVAFLSFAIALLSYRFVLIDLPLAFPAFADHIAQRRLAFVAHVTAAPMALALGAAQVFGAWQARRPGLHRWVGRSYAAAIVVAALSGLVLGLFSPGGPIAAAGFAGLSLAWLVSTGLAVRFALARDIARHRRWMIRSFALTFAAVTLRLYLPAFIASGMSYAQAVPFVAWLCWVPNLAVAEWRLRRARRPLAA